MTKRIPIVLILVFVLAGFAYAQQTPSPEMAAAGKLMQAKKWSEAEKAYLKIVSGKPKNARAWFMLGSCRHFQEDWAGAIKAFKKNVEIANSGAAMYKIAAGYSRMGKSDLAFEWLEKGLKAGAAFTVDMDADKDFDPVRADARFAGMKKVQDQVRNPCKYSKEARQFDFWIGHWDVYVGNRKVGENKIELDTQGCTLVESWKNNRGGLGKSISVYNGAKKKWQQFYVGGQGGVFLFEGEFREEGKVMYFTAETAAPNGGKLMHIFELIDLPDKTVQQRWKQSTDGGKNWNTVWDSIYRKKVSASR